MFYRTPTNCVHRAPDSLALQTPTIFSTTPIKCSTEANRIFYRASIVSTETRPTVFFTKLDELFYITQPVFYNTYKMRYKASHCFLQSPKQLFYRTPTRCFTNPQTTFFLQSPSQFLVQNHECSIVINQVVQQSPRFVLQSPDEFLLQKPESLFLQRRSQTFHTDPKNNSLELNQVFLQKRMRFVSKEPRLVFWGNRGGLKDAGGKGRSP